MADEQDAVAELFATIACEQVVVNEIAAATARLVAIQGAKRSLACLDEDSLHQALALRHAMLGAGA
ncbi:MAG: hypothetical protein IT193_13065 [Propionibacteriaceae bacterium]|nr:hypothetical protein [Propionibacteriaceae bacterium]